MVGKCVRGSDETKRQQQFCASWCAAIEVPENDVNPKAINHEIQVAGRSS